MKTMILLAVALLITGCQSYASVMTNPKTGDRILVETSPMSIYPSDSLIAKIQHNQRVKAMEKAGFQKE